MKTVHELLALAQKKLRKVEISSAELDSELLVCHVLNKDRVWLLTHKDMGVAKKHIVEFDKLLARREQREPMAYILGSKEFYGLEFKVNESVLIPRAETELLVEQVIEKVSQSSKLIADIGTGSGAIAISLATYLPQCQFVATELSQSALSVAQLNAKTHHVRSRISFIQSDLFDKIDQKFDIICANLPYVPQTIQKRLKSDIHFEPALALYGGEDGLDHYRIFFKQVANYLKPHGLVYCESDPWQYSELAKLAKKSGLEPIYQNYLICGFKLS